MKVCFIMYQGNMYSGGQGVYLHYMTRELARLGHEVHVIAGRPYPEVAEGVHLHKLKTFSFWSFLEGRDEYVFETNPLLFFHPLNLYEFASTRATLSSLLLMFSLRAYAKLNELEQDGPFDLIHDNQTLGYGMLLLKARGRPVVANVHHPLAIDRRNDLAQTKGLRHRIGRIVWYPWLMQRVVAHRIDRIITGSDTSAASVQEAFELPREHIAVIHDGVDVDVFRPLEEVEPEPGHVLFVGNSEDRNKGARYLIEALNLLQHDVDFTLTLVDRKMKDLKIVPPLVWKYGLTRLVRYTGHVSTDELVRLYNRAQVLVSPSLYEGFGLPAAEAMACGTPVIATRAGALPEIIEDSVSGLLVPPADPQALAEAIRHLLADRQLCRRMGEAGRGRILERFTWGETARRTAELYREVLSSRREARPSAQPVS